MDVTLGRKLTLSFAVALATLLGLGLVTFRSTRSLAVALQAGESSRRDWRVLDGAERDLTTAVQLATSTTEGGSTERDARIARLVAGAHGALAAVSGARAAEGLRQLVALLGPWQAASVEERSAIVVQAAALSESAARQLTLERKAADGESRARAASAAEAARTARYLLGFVALVLVGLAPMAFIVLRAELRTRVWAEQALALSEAQFRAALDGGLDAFYVLRAIRDGNGEVLDFIFVEVNRKTEALLGKPRNEIVGQRLCELIPANHTNGFFEKYCRVMALGHVLEEDVEVTTADVRAAWIHHQVVPVDDGVAITSRDITERKQHEEALRALSLVDELTGLYNRRGFLTLAQQQLKLAKRGRRELVLLFADMDDFKEINDTFGHKEGDVALTRVAGILRHTFRDSDIIARLGGDEFVVLAADIASGTGSLIVQRLRDELRIRNHADGFPYHLSLSVGLATFDPDRPPSIEELLNTADAMLYEQKRVKRGGPTAAALA